MCVWSATVLDLQEEEEHSLTESIVAQAGKLCVAGGLELSAVPEEPVPVSVVTSPGGVALRVMWLRPSCVFREKGSVCRVVSCADSIPR